MAERGVHASLKNLTAMFMISHITKDMQGQQTNQLLDRGFPVCAEFSGWDAETAVATQ